MGGGACALLRIPSVCHCFHYQSKFKIGKLQFRKLISISIKSWLCAYIYFHVHHHPGIFATFFSFLIFFNCLFMFKTFSLFLVYICCLQLIYLHFMWLIMVLIKSTLLALWKRPCKCANYFVITVSNIYVC